MSVTLLSERFILPVFTPVVLLTSKSRHEPGPMTQRAQPARSKRGPGMVIRYDQPRQVFAIGPGAVCGLADELRVLGTRTVGLIGSRRALASCAGDAVREQLANVEIVAEFGAVTPHAPMTDTENIARAFAGDLPDALVAVGGGSASDTAKAVAILLAEGGSLADHCSRFIPPDRLEHVNLPAPKIPVVAVATTLSGAEITPGGGSTDPLGTKRVFWDPKVAARVVVLDAELVVEAPDDLITTTGMNGLAHCAEGLYSRTASPISSALAVEGVRAFAAALPHVPGSTGNSRLAIVDEALRAACLGGLVISNARVGLHHAVCHVLGAVVGVPHGVANAVMLPYVLDFNLTETPAAADALAHALAAGLGADAALGAVCLTSMVQERAGVPRTLRAAGVTEDQLDEVAQGVMQDRGLYFNPRRGEDVTEVRNLLARAFDGHLTAVA